MTTIDEKKLFDAIQEDIETLIIDFEVSAKFVKAKISKFIFQADER